MSSIFFESPTSKIGSLSSPLKVPNPPTSSTENEGIQSNILPELIKASSSKKRSYMSSPAPDPIGSPNKRLYLHNMSPNVSRKTIYLNHIPQAPASSSSSSGLNYHNNPDHPMASLGSLGPRRDMGYFESRSHSIGNTSLGPQPTSRGSSNSVKLRPARPPLLKPTPSNPRSKSTIHLPSSRSISPKHKLRRTNSLISQGGSSSSSDNQYQSATTSSDRFIPSRHNSTSGKLQTTANTPHPNASPETHIRAQTSKIYQHHVAEACGLDVNSRVLMYQPLPPERKKPISLFSNQLSSNTVRKLNNSSLRPAIASARAKKIPTAPERVLDAPGLIDDFYLNLLAWSSTNLLAIGLEDSVYVWNASTGSVGLLCELPQNSTVSSLRWSEDGSYISIGKSDGLLEIWDIETNTKLRTLNCDNHLTRIASQSWYQHVLTSGSRFGTIYHSDVRIASHVINKLENSHSAEICGIEYKSDGQQFASGGNDNLVCIWDVRQCHSTSASTSSSANTYSGATPLFTRSNHKAAVKALSWCPYQPSLLATGGGSSDKTINFWNTTTGARVNTIETGSQISSLNWGYASGTGMEIVATHGFPTNHISLFNYPTLQKTGEILGAHDSRILSGCLSPDSMTLATVAGDENLKFWSLFDLYKPGRRDGSTDRLNDDDDESNLTSKDDTKSIKKMMNIR